MGIAFCVLTARTATPAGQVCAKKDFMEFIAAFAELTTKQQTECVRFPLQARGRTHATQQAFLRSPAAKEKFIISKKDAEKHGKAASSFFVLDDGTDSANAMKYVYVVTGNDDKRDVILTEGGTFIFETVEFLWHGGQWTLLDVRESDNQ